MIKILFTIFSIAILSATDFSFVPIDGSTVTYKGYHTIHDFKGHSSDFKLTLNCMEDQCVADILIPVESFDSGNPSRDSNMLYYINYWDYPNVRLKSSEFKLPLSNTDMIIHGELDFHGLKRNVELEILFIKTVEEWTVEGKIVLQRGNEKRNSGNFIFNSEFNQ